MRCGRRRGFTLVELITSTAILSIILAATFRAFHVAHQTEAKVGASNRMMQNARVALDRMSQAFRSAYRSRFRNEDYFQGTDEVFNDFNDDSVCFYSVFDTPMFAEGPESDVCEVEFFVARDEESDETGLFMRRDQGFDEDPDQGGFVTHLADGVIGLEVKYYYLGDWQDDWDNELEQGLPEAVMVTITLVDRQQSSRPLKLSRTILLAGGGST